MPHHQGEQHRRGNCWKNGPAGAPWPLSPRMMKRASVSSAVPERRETASVRRGSLWWHVRGETINPQRFIAADAIPLISLPLSGAQWTWPDLLLVRPRRQCALLTQKFPQCKLTVTPPPGRICFKLISRSCLRYSLGERVVRFQALFFRTNGSASVGPGRLPTGPMKYRKVPSTLAFTKSNFRST
jgi:hypothetical protein